MEKTYKEALDFLTQKRAFMGKKKTFTTRFEFALCRVEYRVAKACEPLNKKFEEDKQPILVNLAAVDEEKNIIVENGHYKYTTLKQLELDKKINALVKNLHVQKIEFDPYLANESEIPMLNDYQVEAFRGFVLNENYELKEPEFTSDKTE